MANKNKAAKKVTVAKKPVKKAAPKKIAAKNAAPKKATVKKAAVKKATAKKPVVKKAAAKKISKKAVVPKKAVAKPGPKPVPAKKKAAAKPKAISTAPAMIELSEELVEKAANISKPMMAPVDGLDTAPVTDPIQSFDKKAFNKATSKGDPHSKLHLSSKPKNAIKPSGKKPLW